MAGTKRRPGALPTVQETLLKRRKAAMEARSTRARQQAADRRLARRLRTKKTKEAFVRIERLVKLGRLKDRDTSRLQRLMRRTGPEPLPPAVTLSSPSPADQAESADHRPPADRPLLIIRCRGRSAGMDSRLVKALRLFRLSRLNTAVFAKPTPACLAVLRLLDPFVAWGAPDMRSIRELVYKRGRAYQTEEAGQPTPITDNATVESALGKYGLLCIEDLVHELATCGPAFVQAASFLAPIRLRAPLGGWGKAESRYRGDNADQAKTERRRKRLNCSRDEYINGLLREMI